MDLEQAIAMLRTLVKNNGTNDMRHLDINLVPANEKAAYEKALKVVKLAIMEGKLNQEDLASRIHLN